MFSKTLQGLILPTKGFIKLLQVWSLKVIPKTKRMTVILPFFFPKTSNEITIKPKGIRQ
jgi:hypothetical protein